MSHLLTGVSLTPKEAYLIEGNWIVDTQTSPQHLLVFQFDSAGAQKLKPDVAGGVKVPASCQVLAIGIIKAKMAPPHANLDDQLTALALTLNHLDYFYNVSSYVTFEVNYQLSKDVVGLLWDK
ncbi:hypothetical protein PCASD_13368 [Puccinia coronata f. sp. avenae]|uniref:Uncharacterized protein n=1 Tax=Puccinia coronata f. sp. avenae TaxID=200324 RepID=A0A2N5TZA5_9BASI|nr:hypothetical protein PCASD_13368 [Puccinia coronata f. sp. avenae]